jgi:hypothetical protein
MRGYVFLRDQDGLRHLVRVSAIQLLSDADPCGDTTVAVVAGRALAVPMPLEEFVQEVAGSTR